jgi:hypothetical protein
MQLSVKVWQIATYAGILPSHIGVQASYAPVAQIAVRSPGCDSAKLPATRTGNFTPNECNDD